MIEIVPYRSSWRDEFFELGRVIRSAVGSEVLAIHHIGSTSVPGLDAKDVIDIQMTVGTLAAPVREPLERLGFRQSPEVAVDHLPAGMHLGARELQKTLYGLERRRVHLHVRESGRYNQRYPLLCRDYLRANLLAAVAYGEIKRQLARLVAGDTGAYYDVKDPVFDLMMAGAERWAVETQWHLPETDA